MDVISRMKYLIEILNNASEAYYSGGSELLTDHEWDSMFDELTKLETESGTVLDGSPTHKVSSFTSNGKKVKHEYAALSLPKSKKLSDVIKWLKNRACNLSWKLDGLTLVATYDNGKLTQLVTRGGGEEGDDITHLVPAIGGVLTSIPYKNHLVLRGECVVSYSGLAEYNEEMGTNYDSPRNLASGSCNPQTTLDKVIDRPLEWIVFTLVHADDEDELGLTTQTAQNEWMRSLGFKVVDTQFCGTQEELEAAVEEWTGRVQKFDYPVDGLVITYDDVALSRSGSLTEHHSTTGGFALKWEDEEVDSILREIEWSPSVYSLNPVGIFDSKTIENTNVSRASLCNISEMERLGIGGEGTKIVVIKANKIIPKIIKAEKHGELVIPDKCPMCGQPTEIKVSDSGVKTLVCTNSSCAGKHLKKLERFVSKYGMNIKGLSEQKLKDLIMNGYISTMKDIMHLPEKRSDLYNRLTQTEGWGEKSVENLLTEIEKAKAANFQNIIYAVGIPSCGRNAGKQIASEFGAQGFLEMCDEYKPDERFGALQSVLGDAKAMQICTWTLDDANRELLQDLCNICSIKDAKKVEGGTLSGITVVITGSLNHFKNRDEMQAVIEARGGKVAGSVSKNTTYLINNDITSTSGKNKKAQTLGIEIITEDDFCNKYLSDLM